MSEALTLDCWAATGSSQGSVDEACPLPPRPETDSPSYPPTFITAMVSGGPVSAGQPTAPDDQLGRKTVRDFEPGTEHRSEAQLFGDGGGSTPRNGDVSAMSFYHSGGEVAPPSKYGEPRNFFQETFLRLRRAMRTCKKGSSLLHAAGPHGFDNAGWRRVDPLQGYRRRAFQARDPEAGDDVPSASQVPARASFCPPPAH